jgi:hypothetical protein
VVLVNDMVADPRHDVWLDVGEEGPNPMQIGDSRVVAAWTVRCGGFPPLLHLRN